MNKLLSNFYFKLLSAIFSIYFIIGFLFYLFQDDLIFQPLSADISPSKWGVNNVELVKIKTKDNLELKSWYGSPKFGKPVILYYHGNAGHLGQRADVINQYIGDGYGVMLPSYRGYSGNPGVPSEQDLYLDARAAIDYLVTKRNIKPNCVILYGNSLGAAVTMQMATEYTNIAGAIFVSPFTSVKDMSTHHYPIYPGHLLVNSAFDNYSKAQNITEGLPKLFIHTIDDRVVPLEQGIRLYNRTNDPKDVELIADAGHNTLPNLTPYINKFVAKYKICNSNSE